MNKEQLNLLDRKLKVAYNDHVGMLLCLGNKQLESVKPLHEITVTESIKAFSEQSNRVLFEYGNIISAETLTTINLLNAQIDTASKDNIVALIQKYLKNDLYLKRFDIYVQSIEHRLGHFGIFIDFNQEKYRISTTKALMSVSVANNISRINRSIINDIDMHTLKTPVTPELKPTLISNVTDIVEVKPSFMGISINFNALIEKIRTKT